jgi:anti-sigma regulatory factor (Ser/Thr protein kinase)
MLLDVLDSSQVAAARRGAAALAVSRGFQEDAVGRVALIATEMATNLMKHGRGGYIAVEAYDDGSGAGIEMIASDRGEGIADIARALSDGFSTAGSSGEGLGIIQRQSTLFTVYSQPGHGTVLLSRVAGTAPGAVSGPVLGIVATPYPHETVSGDGWSYAAAAGPTLLLADGSGHGELAHKAATTAITTFQENAGESCTRLMELMHRALAPTRGAAVGLARLDPAEQLVRFVGVGNISAAVVSGGSVKRMVSHNGTAGMLAPRIREFTYPYEGSPKVILHSDGLTTKWDLADYPGLLASHPSVIAAVMFRDFRRGRDDATVVVMGA